MGYLSCRIYATSHFYHSVGLQRLCTQSSKWYECLHKTAQRLANNAWIFFRVNPTIHEYSESSTPFWHKHAITKWISTNSLFARNLHWTRGVTLNPGKRRWATAWIWMNPDCNWDDLFLNQPPIFYSMGSSNCFQRWQMKGQWQL